MLVISTSAIFVMTSHWRRPASPAGLPLCGKGLALTDSLVERLRIRGVQAVTVEGHPVTVEGEASLEELLAALDRRFRRVEGDPLMKRVKGMYRSLIVRAHGGAGDDK